MNIDSNKIRFLSRIGAALCLSDDSFISDAMKKALDEGIDAEEIREVILTAYLFDGYPTALEGFRLLSEVTVETLRTPDEFSYSQENVSLWRERGMPLCKKIYGKQFEQLMNRVKVFAPELSDAMIVEGYGKVLSRPTFSTTLRELCVVAILASKRKPRQLLSHALGAMRLGATPQHIELLIESISEIVPEEILESSVSTIRQAMRKFTVNVTH